MKFLLAICISVFATATMACTDFSGTYKDETMSVYRIDQSGCTSIAQTNSDGTRVDFIVDGQYRLMEEDEWGTISTAANFVGDTLVFDSKMEYKKPFPTEVPEVVIPRTSKNVYSKDASGNLVSASFVYNSTGGVIWSATNTHPKALR